MRFWKRNIDTWLLHSEKINKLMTTLRHFVWLVGLILGLPAAAFLYFSLYASGEKAILDPIFSEQTTLEVSPLEEDIEIPSEDVPSKADASEEGSDQEATDVPATEMEVGNRTIEPPPTKRSLVNGQDATFCDGDLKLMLHMPDDGSPNRIPELPNGATFYVLGTSPVERQVLQTGSRRTINDCTVVVKEIVRQRNSARDFEVIIEEVPEE